MQIVGLSRIRSVLIWGMAISPQFQASQQARLSGCESSTIGAVRRARIRLTAPIKGRNY
jgi:hypothetical protein